MQALIVGAGEMGTWFAAITDDWLTPRFTDIDQSRATAVATTYDATAVDTGTTDPVDVVCTAVPLSETGRVIEQYAPLAERAVIDLSGRMREPVEAMREHAADCERLSLHPLFAPANAPGNVAVVAENPGIVDDDLQRRLREAGNVPFETTPAEHDRAMETIQAKTHAALIAFALAADPVAEEFQTPISAGLTELAGSVLSGTPRVYAEIQSHFPGAEAVAGETARVADADEEGFIRLYREAAERIGGERPTSE